MNVTLFTAPLIIIVAVLVFRHRLPHVARSLHHAQREYRAGGPGASTDAAAAPTDQAS